MRAERLMPGMLDYAHPDRSAEAELGSLKLQFGKIKDLPPPPVEDRVRAFERLVKELPAGPNKAYLDSFEYDQTIIPARFMVEMRAVIHSLKRDSNPGIPLCYHFKTNQEALEMIDEEEIISLAWKRVCSLHAIGGAEETPSEYIRLFACDECRTFIKQELHSRQKAEEGRFRLIMVLSMLDQCIERWLCAGQNRAEINLWETIPCCPGMGLHDEGLAVLRAKMLEMGGPVVSSDVSGFDWQVTEAMLLDDVRLRVALAGCEPGCAYDRVLRSRVRCLSRSVIVLSDGTVVHQKRYGVQKSGSYNTSSTNSHMRAALAYMSGSNAAITMGDDCVEAPAHGAEEWYARYFPLKTPYRPTKQAEFCSIIFDLERGAGDPKCYMNSRIQKQLATLLDKKPQTPEAQLELVEAFHQNARHPGGFPDIADLWDFLVRVGWVQWENQLN